MKRLFLGIMAAGIMLSACNQAAKTAKTADSTVAQTSATDSSAAKGTSAATSANYGTGIGKGPMMKFEFESHDFGKVNEGDKVTYKFNFANTGKSPLIITDAHASCGCTTPTWPKGPILPGNGGQILVVFNSAGHPGLVDKQITIIANTTPPENVVHLVGEVVVKK